jgi:hypothetical protein
VNLKIFFFSQYSEMKLKENFKVLDTSEPETWTNYINILPETNKDFYFTPSYYRIHEGLGDGRAQCFVYEKGNEFVLYPYLLNCINDLGYSLDDTYYDIQGAYGYNGLITNSNDHGFIGQFHREFENYCKEKNIVAEFTRFHPLLMNHKRASDKMQVNKDRNTISLDLRKPYNKIWEMEYSSGNRNMIRKAVKRNLRNYVYRDPAPGLINEFSKLYQDTMKKLNAENYYYFNTNYFRSLFNDFKSNIVLINTVDTENSVNASAIFIIYGKYAHYHLSARKPTADSSSNNYMLDEAIKYSQECGAEFFHLGGGTTSQGDDPLLKFKKNFSRTTCEFYTGKRIYFEKIYGEIIRQWEALSVKGSDHENFLLRYRKYNN